MTQQNPLEQAVAASLTPFAISDSHGYLTYANPAFGELWVLEQGESLLGRAFWTLGSLSAELSDILNQLTQNGRWQGQLTIDSNGRWQRLEINISLMANTDQASPLLTLSLHDVTRHHQRHELQQKLANALEQTPDTVIITDKQGVIEHVNRAFTTITSYTREEAIGQTPAILKSGHQEQAFYADFWEKLLAGQTLRHTIINKRKNGELYYEDRIVTPMVNEQGEITHFIGIGRDVTEQLHQKVAQQKLTNAVEQTADSVVITDKEGVIEYVNQAFTAVTGYTREEAIGQTPRLLKSDQHDHVFYETLWQNLLRGQAVRQTFINKRKNGELYYDDRTITPLLNEKGEITHFIATGRDITQAKLLEQQMATVYEFGQELIASHSEEEIIQRFLQMILKLFQSDLGLCGLIDHHKQELVYEHWATSVDFACTTLRFPLKGDTSLGVMAIQQGAPLYVAEVHDEPRYAYYHGFTARSAYCVPIAIQGDIIGVVTVESQSPDNFSLDDRRFLDILTQQLGLALHNARLFATEQQQAKNLDLLYQASRTISSSLDLPQVLQTLLHKVKTLFSAYTASVILYDELEDRLSFAAVAEGDLDSLSQVVILPDHSLAGWVLRQQQSLLIADAQNDARFFPQVDAVTGLTTRSLLAVPLSVGAKKVGVVEVLSEQPHKFEPYQLIMLEYLSANAAIAIENANHFATERQLKEHLQQSQAQLLQSEKMGALGRLTASLAHEINNPLQSVQGFLTLIAETIPPAEMLPKPHRYLQIVEDEVLRISNLVQQMRDFYRPSQQEMSPINVHDILDSVLILSHKQIKQHFVQVKLTWAVNTPLVWGNPAHLKQVFLNLLLNAVDAMPSGGELHIKTTEDALLLADNRITAVRITFQDTGQGIPPEIVPRIFEPFVTTKSNGTGLGLSVSYNIIEVHGGQMKAESKLGQGTTISILLPLMACD